MIKMFGNLLFLALLGGGIFISYVYYTEYFLFAIVFIVIGAICMKILKAF